MNYGSIISKWIRTREQLPDEGEVVETKSDDELGCRNFGRLMRQGKLWFTEDGKMYVYYTPTHWRPV